MRYARGLLVKRYLSVGRLSRSVSTSASDMTSTFSSSTTQASTPASTSTSTSTSTPTSKRPATPLDTLYKTAMSGVAAPAMVITTNHVNKKTQLPEPRGLTVSSVTSVSIKPSPLISFNIQIPSRTSQVLHDANHFAVNILPASSESAEICRVFSGKLGRNVNPFEVEKSLLSVGLSGIPIVTGAISVLYCTSVKVIPVQDHEIWIASVNQVESNQQAGFGNLLFQNHKFHNLGEVIDDL